jgi:hypothetical protein
MNKRHAVIVRLGEKQILCGTIEKLNAMQQGDQDNGKKRKAEEKIEQSKKTKKCHATCI